LSLIIGIDGCKSGWFSIWENQDKSIHSSVFSNLNELKNFFKNESQLILGIDMPVVLSEVIPRQADQLARKLLSKKASSVFTAPTPEMLDQPNYEKASLVSKRLFGKSMSLQSWYLFPKIKDVQTMIHHEDMQIYEIHPELSFRAMNNEQVILESKKTHEGFALRNALLSMHFKNFIFEDIRNQHARKDVMDNDILDALAVLWSAKRIQSNQASYLPQAPEKPNMQIVY
jgi:predicted RNase H-like nuclease